MDEPKTNYFHVSIFLFCFHSFSSVTVTLLFIYVSSYLHLLLGP